MTRPGRNQVLLFAAALLLQAGVLAAFQFQREHRLTESRLISVRVLPVDPRDLFRGDYVTLGYAFSRLDRRQLRDDLGPDLPRAARLYVKLKGADPAAGDWRAVAVARRPFARLAPDEVMLTGTLVGQGPDFLDLHYGCESFYVPEGEGRKLEARIREHQVMVDLAVTRRGQAQPVTLKVDGKPVEFGKP